MRGATVHRGGGLSNHQVAYHRATGAPEARRGGEFRSDTAFPKSEPEFDGEDMETAVDLARTQRGDALGRVGPLSRALLLDGPPGPAPPGGCPMPNREGTSNLNRTAHPATRL